jgi:hypothetical protein
MVLSWSNTIRISSEATQTSTKFPTVEKGVNIDPINITNLKDANPNKAGTSLDIEVQTTKIPSISTTNLLRIDKATQMCKEDVLPKVKEESSTNMVSKVHVTMTPCQHPNRKS